MPQHHQSENTTDPTPETQPTPATPMVSTPPAGNGAGSVGTSGGSLVPDTLEQVTLPPDDKPRDRLGQYANRKNDGWNRQERGKFGPGNQGPKRFDGGPIVRKVQSLRTVMIGCVGAKDVIEVMAALVEKAKAGDIAAIKEFLLRTFGPADAMDLLLRLDELEREVIKRSRKAEAPTLQLTSEQEELNSIMTDLAAREREAG